MHRSILTPLNSDVDEINKYQTGSWQTLMDLQSPFISITVQTQCWIMTKLQHIQQSIWTNWTFQAFYHIALNCLLDVQLYWWGLANGTRLIITKLMTHLFEAQITNHHWTIQKWYSYHTKIEYHSIQSRKNVIHFAMKTVSCAACFCHVNK